MAKLVFNALLKQRGDGVQAKLAEFPDIKVRSWSIGGALARLRTALQQRMRWTRIETSCAGEPLTPTPAPETVPASGLATAIEIDVKAPERSGGTQH